MIDQNITFEEAGKIHKNLISKILACDKAYYEENSPIILDSEYDQLVIIAKALEEKYPALSNHQIFTKVSGGVSVKFNKVEHKVPMLSLSNIFDMEEVGGFIEKIQKYIKINYFPKIIAELKIDGLSFSAIYKHGKLVVASTRGDGKYGEDVTANIKTIKNFPHQINTKLEILEVRGEIFIDKLDFDFLNQTQQLQGKQIFANPRNAAAGSLRQLNSGITAERPLKYFVYSVGELSEKLADTQYNLLCALENLGFSVCNEKALCQNEVEILDFYKKIEAMRNSLGYEIDGLVYKLDDLKLSERLGFVGRTPRFAVAHKFPAEIAKTKLNNIEVQVGRTGALTPVAILEPINIAGVIVSRASLYNFEEIERKDLRVGDVVSVQRAGDVIPKIMFADIAKRTNFLNKYIPPYRCPACDELVIKDDENAVIRCENIQACPAQILEKLIHFASKACLAIDGLGEKQIEFLLKNGYIEDISDILNFKYSARLSELRKEEGWGDKSVDNLLTAIENSINTSLDRFIFAMSIRYVGEISSKLLAKIFGSADNFLDSMENLATGDIQTKSDLSEIDGIGPKIITSLIEFFSINSNKKIFREVANILNIAEVENSGSGILQNKIIVFTGALNFQSRAEAKNLAEKLGAKVTNSITSKTDYLICGKDPGSKIIKAKKLDIKILQENEWLDLVQ